MQVIPKSIGISQSYRSLNIQNIARNNFKQRSFSVLQEKLNLANVSNNLIYHLLMETVFRLQKTKDSLQAIFADQTTERLTLFTGFVFFLFL